MTNETLQAFLAATAGHVTYGTFRVRSEDAAPRVFSVYEEAIDDATQRSHGATGYAILEEKDELGQWAYNTSWVKGVCLEDEPERALAQVPPPLVVCRGGLSAERGSGAGVAIRRRRNAACPPYHGDTMLLTARRPAKPAPAPVSAAPSATCCVALLRVNRETHPLRRVLGASEVPHALDVHPHTIESWIGWESMNRDRTKTTAIYKRGRDGLFHLVFPTAP